jgi:hypothetical protein
MADLRLDRGDHVQAAGQRIPVPARHIESLSLLAAGEHPMQADVTLAFSDGWTQTSTVNLPSWREVSNAPLLVDVARPDAPERNALQTPGMVARTAAQWLHGRPGLSG